MSFSAVTAAFLSVVLGQSSAITDTIRAEQQRLNACIEKTESDPDEAYEDALAWLNEGARPNAQYCAALSLSALGHHAEAAIRLEALSQLEGSGDFGGTCGIFNTGRKCLACWRSCGRIYPRLYGMH